MSALTGATFYALRDKHRRDTRLLTLIGGLTFGLPLIVTFWFVASIEVTTADVVGHPLAAGWPIVIAVASIIGLVRALLILLRKPDAQGELERLGGRLVGDADAPWLIDAVAEMSLAAGIDRPAIALVPGEGVGVVALGEGSSAVVVATEPTAALPADELRVLVGRAIGLLVTGGTRSAEVIGAVSSVFDPRKAGRKVAIGCGLPLLLFVLIVGALIVASGEPAGLIILAIAIPSVGIGIAANAGAFAVVNFLIVWVVRAIVAAPLMRENAGLADALAVELTRDPGPLERFLTDVVEGRTVPATFLDRGIATLSPVPDRAASAAIVSRIEALRSLAGLAPTELEIAAPPEAWLSAYGPQPGSFGAGEEAPVKPIGTMEEGALPITPLRFMRAPNRIGGLHASIPPRRDDAVSLYPYTTPVRIAYRHRGPLFGGFGGILAMVGFFGLVMFAMGGPRMLFEIIVPLGIFTALAVGMFVGAKALSSRFVSGEHAGHPEPHGTTDGAYAITLSAEEITIEMPTGTGRFRRDGREVLVAHLRQEGKHSTTIDHFDIEDPEQPEAFVLAYLPRAKRVSDETGSAEHSLEEWLASWWPTERTETCSPLSPLRQGPG